MQQEINLYLLLPQAKTVFLTPKRMIWSYLGFIFLLFIHFCLEGRELHQAQLHLDSQKQESTVFESKLAAIHAEYPMLDVKDLEGSLKKLQQDLEDKNKIFSLLTTNLNFSTYLLGLAKSSVAKLWLHDLQMDIEDKNIVLKGTALDSKAVQQFLTNLAEQKEFSGLHFQLQNLQKVEEKKEILLHFIITSQVKS